MRTVSKSDAALRILCAWIDSCLRDQHYALRCKLRDVLTHQNVEAVAKFDLLREFADFEQRRKLLDKSSDWDERKGREILRAWLADAPISGRLQ